MRPDTEKRPAAAQALRRSLARLNAQLDGDVMYDHVSRMLYASDASLYQQLPLAVARPRHAADCERIVQFARNNGISLIPRAAGTSLAGQVVGDGMVMDTSRYMTQLIALDPDQREARVEPGVVLQRLNGAAAEHGLMFAPDPSTLNRCTIAGVIGNNAWGAHALRYGTSRDHVRRLCLLTAGGDALAMGDLSADQLAAKCKDPGPEGVLYRAVTKELDATGALWLQRYPRADRVPCNMGYGLHLLASRQPWNHGGLPFSLVPLICGSEGTLGLMTEATVALTPRPGCRVLVAAHFATLAEALHAVTEGVAAGAAAVELLDSHILSLARGNLEQRRHSDWIQGEPLAVLLMEWHGDDAGALRQAAADCVAKLRNQGSGYHWPVLDGAAVEAAWAVRRAGLGLLMGMPGPRKPATFVEDSAVPVAELASFTARVESIMAAHGVDCVYYGSVGMGLIHLRPILDLHDPAHRELLPQLAAQVADCLKAAGGCISAKHGDGRVRSPFMEAMLGEELVASMDRIKRAFDGDGLLNPGNELHPRPLRDHWRAAPTATGGSYRPWFDWSADGTVLGAVERCHGAAACRKAAGDGVMCPSYMATGEEAHSTRGRANVYRQLIQTYGYDRGIAHAGLHQVLDLCLACKGCRAECPANVDMARLKAEHLQHYHDRHGTPLRSRLISQFTRWSRMASSAPRLANRLLGLDFIKALAGFHPERSMPTLAPVSLQRWFARHQQPANAAEQVVLLADPFTNFYDVAVGEAAVRLLNALGYGVILSPCFASARTAISQGQLSAAKARISRAARWLLPYAVEGVPIIGLEPSELLTWRDEAKAFPLGADMERAVQVVSGQAVLLEEFLCRRRETIEKRQPTWRSTGVQFLVHGHCHQKSLAGMDACLEALRMIPDASVTTIPSGCCGMAGAFGYEAEHYRISMNIGEMILFPAVRQAGDSVQVVATGTSCRHQIADGTGRRAVHPAQALYQAITEPAFGP